jgi:hypothetical protein
MRSLWGRILLRVNTPVARSRHAAAPPPDTQGLTRWNSTRIYHFSYARRRVNVSAVAAGGVGKGAPAQECHRFRRLPEHEDRRAQRDEGLEIEKRGHAGGLDALERPVPEEIAETRAGDPEEEEGAPAPEGKAGIVPPGPFQQPDGTSGRQVSRGGTKGEPPRRRSRIESNRRLPSAARAKSSAAGEISATALLVATKETPQKTIAANAPSRGRNVP